MPPTSIATESPDKPQPSGLLTGPPNRRNTLIAGLVLAVLTVAFFWQPLFTANTWIPAGGGDLVPFLYPNYHFAAETLKQGTIPLWNPHLYSGIPFAADAQSGLFYPINLVVFLLAPTITVKTLTGLAIFHFWLAGFGMFLYLQYSPPARNIQLHPLAALTGAVAFEFSDLFIVHFGNLNMIAVAAWLPLVMLYFQQGIVKRRWRQIVAAGVLLGIATLASHIQITLFILLAMGLFTLWTMVLDWTQNNWPARVRPALYLLLALLVALGLAALWFIPTMEMSTQTLRAELSYQETTAYALHPAQLVGLLVPNYFGRDPALHWGPWERVETGYIGILTLLLALLTAVLYRNRYTGFWLLLAGVSLLLALGDSSILHGWLSLSPGFGQFRAPARYILLLDFSLAALAATGVHLLMVRQATTNTLNRILKPLSWFIGGLVVVSLPLAYYALLITQDRHPDIFLRAQNAATGVTTFALLAGISLIFLHLANRQTIRPRTIGLAALTIIALDLFSLGANVDVGHTDPTTGYQHPEAIAFLQAEGGVNRLETTTDIWHLWQPDSALLYGLYDAWGLYNPLTLADTTRYWQQVGPRNSGTYNFLGIKHIVAGKGGAPADGDIVPIFDKDPDINIYLNRAALPRVLFVSQAIHAADHEAAWEAIRRSDFNPAQTVVLEEEPPYNSQPATPATLGLSAYNLHRVTITVDAPQAGYVVLADAFYPGWQATINGSPTPILRANYAFRAVAVPPGTHTIHMDFKPLSWTIGLLTTLITLLGLSGLLLWSLRRFRKL